MEDTTSKPSSVPDDFTNYTIEQKSEYLSTITNGIIKKVWHHMDTKSLLKSDPSSDSSESFCCGDDTLDEPIVECAMRIQCKRGQHFHFSWADLDPDVPFDEIIGYVRLLAGRRMRHWSMNIHIATVEKTWALTHQC